jgi:NAD(P)-dependent dehydrogenase (short-subunit alcohol dehydrogenase family)
MQPHGVGVSVLCPGIIATALGTSARNRPAALGGGKAPEHEAGEGDASGGLMSPAVFAEQVLEAVRADRFFVSSHPEFRDLVGQRNDAVRASFRGSPDPVAVASMRALIEPFRSDA